MRWTLPLIFIIYLIRQKKERKYVGELFEKDLKRNILSNIVKEHYELYKKQCYFAHREFLELDGWKKLELKRINEKNKIGQNVQH